MTVEEWAKQQQNSAEAELLRAAGAPRQPVSEVAAPPAPPVADSAPAQAQVVAVVTDQATAEWFYQRFKWRPRGRQAVGERQRHGRIVGPGAGRQTERAAADHVLQARLRIAGAEFERRAQRVANGQTEEGPERPVSDAVRVVRWNRRRLSRALRHVGFLPGFDGPGPNVAHATNRPVRARAQLHEQAGGNGLQAVHHGGPCVTTESPPQSALSQDRRRRGFRPCTSPSTGTPAASLRAVLGRSARPVGRRHAQASRAGQRPGRTEPPRGRPDNRGTAAWQWAGSAPAPAA